MTDQSKPTEPGPCSARGWNHSRRVQSDNRDGRELVMAVGFDGDYYLCSRKTGDRMLLGAVRFCIGGGGAASLNPKLGLALKALWEAIGEENDVQNDAA